MTESWWLPLIHYIFPKVFLSAISPSYFLRITDCIYKCQQVTLLYLWCSCHIPPWNTEHWLLKWKKKSQNPILVPQSYITIFQNHSCIPKFNPTNLFTAYQISTYNFQHIIDGIIIYDLFILKWLCPKLPSFNIRENQ